MRNIEIEPCNGIYKIPIGKDYCKINLVDKYYVISNTEKMDRLFKERYGDILILTVSSARYFDKIYIAKMVENTMILSSIIDRCSLY